MANEIYDSTWWGNTRQTASSIGTSTEMIQGQFNLTKIGDEEVTNGDFATDSDWTKGNNWTIDGGKANYNNSSNNQISQNIVLNTNTYQLKFTISNSVGLGARIWIGNSVGNTSYTDSLYQNYTNGDYNIKIVVPSNQTSFAFWANGAGSSFSIDNVSVKQVRATTVEASKCLADTIHRIGLQDIQN
jgi:hypothetical protein